MVISPLLQRNAQTLPGVPNRGTPTFTQHIPASEPEEQATPARTSSHAWEGEDTVCQVLKTKQREDSAEWHPKGWDMNPAAQRGEGLRPQWVAAGRLGSRLRHRGGLNTPRSASSAASVWFNPPGITKSSVHGDAHHHLCHSHNTARTSRPSRGFPLHFQQ